jgi:hypothetical protein
MTDLLILCWFLLPWALGLFYAGLWMVDACRAAIRDRTADERRRGVRP